MRVNQKGQGEVISIIMLVLFICIGIWTWHHVIHRANYSKPWWTGTEPQTVCLIGTGCYTLNVFSSGESTGYVYFPNGGKIEPSNTTCQKDDDFGQICTFQDSQGRQWEIRRS